MGPVGATLANLLALRGVNTVILEREADVYRLPRAVQFDGECMRVFQAVGIAEAMEPDLRFVPGMRFLDSQGHMLIDWARPPGVGPQGWLTSYRFHQPALERTLRHKLSEYGCVDVCLQHDVFSIEPQAETALIRLEDLKSGRLLETRARYVVGCDGARSLVRRFMGTELDDLKSHERWLVVDVLLKSERPDLGDYSVQYCNPLRPATYVRGIGVRRRWELMLLPEEDSVAMMQPEAVWSLLAQWVRPEEAILERPAAYTFHSVVARGWRREQLLIAGDSAHQSPPFMGQGMCAGVRDAANLAWKLADVLEGRASDDLLNTYETERAPHVREFIETAVRLGGVIRGLGPAGNELGGMPKRFTTPEPRLGPGAHGGDGHAGTLSEQPRLANGMRLDEIVGYQPALLATSDLLNASRTWANNLVKPVAADGAAADYLNKLNVGAALIRPDRYLAGTAHDALGLTELLERYAEWSSGHDTAA